MRRARAAGGPEITAAWNAVSLRLRTAAISPSRLSKRRNTVPLPTPARAATASVVTASTPQLVDQRLGGREQASRLRAASLRSGGGLVEERQRWIGTSRERRRGAD